MFQKTLWLSIFAIGTLILTGTPKAEATFPEKEITLILPYTKNGTTGQISRVLTRALNKVFSYKVKLEVIASRGALTGGTAAMNAAPDGYTLLIIGAGVLTMAPTLNKNIPFDVDSFTYVANISEYQMSFITRKDSPYNDWGEMIAYARANPNKPLQFVESAIFFRTLIQYLGKQEGINIEVKKSSILGETIPRLLDGQLDVAWTSGVHERFAEDIKYLAAITQKGLIASPDTPLLSEYYPNLAFNNNVVIVAPKGTPDNVVNILNRGINQALKNPALHKGFKKLSIPVSPKNPAETEKLVRTNRQVMLRILENIGLMKN